MSKDPAVLFYTSDFLTGTLTMGYEQKGKYITLLCLQHQKGVLTEKDMINICGTLDKEILDKFIKDSDGNYYNKRMKEEHEKRANYSKSRRENRLKGIDNKKVKTNNICKSYNKHMENENEDININNNKGVYREFKHLKLTINDFNKLKEDYTKSQIDDILNKIENYKNNKKYNSLYLTSLNWLKKEHPIVIKPKQNIIE